MSLSLTGLTKAVSNIASNLIPYRLVGNHRIVRRLHALKEMQQWSIWQDLLQQPRFQDPKRLLKYGFKAYSQTDEDGIIQEIFKRIGIKHKTFIEIGAGKGLENNSMYLLLQGWRGAWFDGSGKNINQIHAKFRSVINSGQLLAEQHFFTKENINELLQIPSLGKEVDLLSIDVDGNDYHLFDAIDAITPRMVVIEYNTKFRPPVDWIMQYNPNHVWDGSDYVGASLKALEQLFKRKGYALVGCNITGNNAFFVQQQLTPNLFCEPFTAENHYEPARYFLTGGIYCGHPENFGAYVTDAELNNGKSVREQEVEALTTS